MEESLAIARWPELLFQRIDLAWTFLLLVTRYGTFLAVVPGIGQGFQGLAIRLPLVLCLAGTSILTAKTAPIPGDLAVMIAQLIVELLLGSLVGIIPLLVVSGAQAAGTLVTGSIGLNGANLFDPTANTALPDLARMYGDLAIILFLMLGGHYVAIQTLVTISQSVAPGSFLIDGRSLELLVEHASSILEIGVMLSAPVIIALLLTNFVMGLVTKAVPSVNIFAVSFPITIGIGLVLSAVALPEMVHFLERQFLRNEKIWSEIVAITIQASNS